MADAKSTSNNLYTATWNDKDADESHKLTANYDFGGTLAEAVEKFGEECVLNHFKSSGIVSLQSKMRSAAKANGVDSVQDSVDNWVLGIVVRRGKSTVEKMQTQFEKMSEAEQAAFIEQIRAAAGS